MLKRILNTRRLFMGWATAVFALAFAGAFVWILDARGGLLVWVVLASLGGGWLSAYYVWHLNYAAAHGWGSLAPPKHDEGKDRDV